MAVSCLINEMCMKQEIHQFPLHAALYACFLSSREYGSPWLHLLANICKMLSAVCRCFVRVKHQVSVIPILLYFPKVPWPQGNNVWPLYHNFSLQLAFPPHNSYAMCVSNNTLIKVIHKHNIRSALLPLLAWCFKKLFWTFSITLSAFPPKPSNRSSRYPSVHDCPSTAVSALLPCHMSQ